MTVWSHIWWPPSPVRGDGRVVLRDGEPVGAVHQRDGRWYWTGWIHPAGSGEADSLQAALEAVRQDNGERGGF